MGVRFELKLAATDSLKAELKTLRAFEFGDQL